MASPSSTRPQEAPTTPAGRDVAWVSASWITALDRRLGEMTSHAECPVRSLRVVASMSANVAAHPGDAHFRKIRLDNTSFRRRVWEVRGGREVCEALGWHHVPCDDAGHGAVVVLPTECVVLPTGRGSVLASDPSPRAVLERSLDSTRR